MALTPAQIAALQAVQNGQVTTPPGQVPPSQVVQVQSYPGCPQTAAVGQTQQNLPIDVSQFNKEQAGLFVLHIDRTNTSISTARMLTLGGSVAIPSDAALAREYYNFGSSVNFLFDEDVANVIGGNEANFNPTVFLPFLDLLFVDKHLVFQRLDAKDNTSDAGAFAAFAANKVLKRSLVPHGNWEVISPNIEPVFCDPCLNENDTRASWIGYMPVSGLDMVAISLPDGLKATLEFCVFQYENARNMTLVGAQG